MDFHRWNKLHLSRLYPNTWGQAQHNGETQTLETNDPKFLRLTNIAFIVLFTQGDWGAKLIIARAQHAASQSRESGIPKKWGNPTFDSKETVHVSILVESCSAWSIVLNKDRNSRHYIQFVIILLPREAEYVKNDSLARIACLPALNNQRSGQSSQG